jgi:hypothetical protein
VVLFYRYYQATEGLPKKIKKFRYDLLIGMGFSWGAGQNPLADENKKAGIYPVESCP